MRAGDVTRLLREIRVNIPRTIRDALTIVDRFMRDLLDVQTCLLELDGRRTVYITRLLPGVSRESLSGALSNPPDKDYRVCLLEKGERAGGAPDCDRDAPISSVDIPIFCNRRKSGRLTLVKRGDAVIDIDEEAVQSLSEGFSATFSPFLSTRDPNEAGDEVDPIRDELLEASSNDSAMRGIMLKMLDMSGGEFCAYYTESAGGAFHFMLDCRELSNRIPEIREKLKTTHDMFANKQSGTETYREKVYYRSRKKNLAYLVGSSRIESYFIIPVAVRSRVQGVLYFGSVRKDAFFRENIARFRTLADEGETGSPIVYKLGGETAILENVLEVLPFGGALVSRDGSIISTNREFSRTLMIEGAVPDKVGDIGKVSAFELGGVWEEFNLPGGKVRVRELRSSVDPERSIEVSWVKIDQLAEEAGSLLLLRDVSESLRYRTRTEEVLALTAHELRTPMTAIKNSLKIILDNSKDRFTAQECSPREKAEAQKHFMETALRTMDRLGIMVDGLIDGSDIRMPVSWDEAGSHDARRFMEEATVLFDNSLEKKRIELGIEVDSKVSTLEFSGKMMEQVVQNLVSNSLKHIPEEGKILIRISPCEGIPGWMPASILEDYLPPMRYVDIEVADSGPGIPEEIAKAVNESYPSGGDKPLRGLGLFIAGRLIRSHGGEMLVKRNKRNGGSVDLFLPADRLTGMIVRTIRSIAETFSKMIMRGAAPSVYFFTRNGKGCWLEFAGEMKTHPLVNPSVEEVDDHSFCFWPLGERCAIALTADKSFHTSPMSFMNYAKGNLILLDDNTSNRVETGWAVFPRDGKTFDRLLEVSVGKADFAVERAVLKGEGG